MNPFHILIRPFLTKCSVSTVVLDLVCAKVVGIYLTKKTSINIRYPKFPEVGQLTNHHIRKLLHKLHSLWCFIVPCCNTQAQETLQSTNHNGLKIIDVFNLKAQREKKNHDSLPGRAYACAVNAVVKVSDSPKYCMLHIVWHINK